jgi:ABC-type transport system involved in cytochrome c biogenesis permease subunit
LAPGIAAVRAQEAGKEFDQQAINRLAEFLNRYENFALMAHPFLVPPQHPETRREEWLNMGTALIELARGGALSPAVTHYATLATAFRQNKPAEFNRALAEYRQWLGQKFPRELGKGRLEFFYNDFQAFYKATVIYLLGFLLACASWFKFSEWLRRSAFYLIVLAWFLHTIGMVLRMILEGRPPVTNFYSSAVFIGWGAVALGLVLERFYRDGIGSVTAASVGLITQIIAHNLALGGDTMEVLRAVLDTNFWLATHVITITLGYSANFVAGFLATIYVLRGVLTRSLDKARAEALTGMVYGIICFATLFNFLGTVLGGIWADQSWGRFWGWDPKENGALIIVLWNAIILHARWGGMIHQRGLMNTAIFGNVVTAFSWFGVNMLGVGLHAYGFMDQAFPWLLAFVASQVVLIAIGLIPQSMWLSFRPLPIRSPPFPLEFKARRRPAIEGGD